MKKIIPLFFILSLMLSFSASENVNDLKSIKILVNKYGNKQLEMRQKLIKKMESLDIEEIEEIIWSVKNEILQLGVIKARDLDLRDMYIIWMKKFGVVKIQKNPKLAYLNLGVRDKCLHIYKMALSEISKMK